MPRKSLLARITAAILMVAALSFAVAACGSDDSSSDSPPEPVAQIDPVTGVSTKVTLDAGFVDALTALKVTPARSARPRSARTASPTSRSPAETSPTTTRSRTTDRSYRASSCMMEAA